MDLAPNPLLEKRPISFKIPRITHELSSVIATATGETLGAVVTRLVLDEYHRIVRDVNLAHLDAVEAEIARARETWNRG